MTRRSSGCGSGSTTPSGYFRQAISRRLRMKVAPAVTFEIDKVFEQAAHVEQLLREIQVDPPADPRGSPRPARSSSPG